MAKQALGIGLANGLELKEGAVFNGIKAVNREEACLYAFNTLQADLVEYGQRLTTNINGTEVTLSSGGAQAKKWANQTQQTRINNIREDEIIQFAEEYFRRLEKKLGDDEFMRPAYTWIYDKEEIGTYVDWTLMTEEYTTGVTGRDMYDLLGSALLNDADMDLVYYFNGVEPDNGCPLPAYVTGAPYTGGKNITKNNGVIARNNQNDVGFTDDGVLTQVFVDKDNRESIIITSIDTWLAQGGANYNESSETAPLETWTGANSNPGYTWNVDVADVPEVADVVEDDWYLVTVSFKNDANGEVVTIDEPEILEDSVVTKFSVDTIVAGQTGLPTKLTVGGTEYKAAAREYYDPTALYEYNETLLTDRNYNVFLDPYGYSIGIELNEGVKKYVFITGFDRPSSNLAVKTADAAAIFLDGTMEEIKVNVQDTDKKINAANGKKAGVATPGANQYFLAWQDITAASPQRNGWHVLNRWFTYTVNDAGVYTLKPATNMVAYKAGTAETIKTASLYLDDNVMVMGNNPYQGVLQGAAPGTAINAEFAGILPGTGKYAGPNTARCYGNDDSVYITVETDIVDTLAVASNITGVTGVYTGVQNVEIELDPTQMTVANNRHLDEADVYAVFDGDNYVVGAVTVGEGNGGNATIAYVTDGVQNERVENGIYYWEFKAVVDGTVQTLTAKEKYGSIMNSQLDQTDVANEADNSHKAIAAGTYGAGLNTTNWNAHDGIVELRFDADGYVVSVKSVEESKIYSYYGDKDAAFGGTEYYGNNSVVDADSAAATHQTPHANFTIADAKAYRIGGIREEHVGAGHYAWQVGAGDIHHYDSAPQELTLVGRTLYVTPGQKDEGLALASDAKAVVIQQENGKWKTREFTNVSSAIAQVADADGISTNGKQYDGEIVAAMGSNGQAKWVVFTSYTDLQSGSGLNVQGRLTRISMTNGGVLGGASSWRHVKADPAGTDPVTGVSPVPTNRSYVDITLVGTNVGSTYNVELQMYSTFTNSWGTVLRIPVAATAGNTVSNTTTILNQNVGALNNGSLYRLVCSDLVTDTVEQALYV